MTLQATFLTGHFYLPFMVYTHAELFISDMYTTCFHHLPCVSDDRHLLSSLIFLHRRKKKKFTSPWPEMKIPVTNPFVCVLQIASFIIATTTRNQTSPSLFREEDGTIFITDSEDSCTCPRRDSSRST
uniref:Uncharacterized protein n=1 Tax=Octopus bimaculoides TaxID=37653 RepID=A0A0L8IC84_OCTBM